MFIHYNCDIINALSHSLCPYNDREVCITVEEGLKNMAFLKTMNFKSFGSVYYTLKKKLMHRFCDQQKPGNNQFTDASPHVPEQNA